MKLTLVREKLEEFSRSCCPDARVSCGRPTDNCTPLVEERKLERMFTLGNSVKLISVAWLLLAPSADSIHMQFVSKGVHHNIPAVWT